MHAVIKWNIGPDNTYRSNIEMLKVFRTIDNATIYAHRTAIIIADNLHENYNLHENNFFHNHNQFVVQVNADDCNNLNLYIIGLINAYKVYNNDGSVNCYVGIITETQ